MRTFPGPLVALVALSLLACGDDGPTNPLTGPAAGTTTPAPTVTSVRITGNRDLTPGATSQLTLTGSFTDGSSRNITAESTWVSSATSVVTVSAGLVTAVGIGSSRVTAAFQGWFTVTDVISLPVGTFFFSGRAREPGSGSLAGVRVLELLSNASQVTDSSGNFSFAGLPAARFRIEHSGFEPVEYATTPPSSGRTVFVDAPLQRVVRVAAGQSTGRQQIAPNDVAYSVGSDSCNPCKLIRVSSAGSGELILRLTWEGLPGALRLWVNGTRNSSAGSSITVAAQPGGSETLVYVGWISAPSNYAFFNLSVD